MDIEKMSQLARESARARIGQIEARRIVRTAEEITNAGLFERLNKQKRLDQEAQEQYYESLKPQLEDEARIAHQKRFAPLRQMLAQFEAPVREIRDRYFPESKIAVVEGYDGSNLFHRSLVVLGKKTYGKEGQRLFGVHAVAVKPGGFDSTKETIYRAEVSVKYLPEGTFREATQDMDYISDESELFHIYEDRFYLGDSNNSQHEIRGGISKWIDFEIDPSGAFTIKRETWQSEDPAEVGFMEILETMELHDSLAERGLPLNSY